MTIRWVPTHPARSTKSQFTMMHRRNPRPSTTRIGTSSPRGRCGQTRTSTIGHSKWITGSTTEVKKSMQGQPPIAHTIKALLLLDSLLPSPLRRRLLKLTTLHSCSSSPKEVSPRLCANFRTKSRRKPRGSRSSRTTKSSASDEFWTSSPTMRSRSPRRC